ncbi:MAG: proline iminopeptidase-family hydrolase [Rhodoferax sp.]
MVAMHSTPSGEGMIAVPGGRVWYRIEGQGARGVPLLVLHGGPGAPHDYLENLVALADQRPVVFYDQLGCGRSERPDDPALWQLERFVTELAAVRQALGLQRVHLLGQSWGSMLAVQSVLAGAIGIERLVLSGPCLSAPRWIADQRAWLAKMPLAVGNAVAIAEALGDYEAAAYQQAMQLYYQQHLCRLDPWPDCLQRSLAGLGMQVYLTLWGPSEFTCNGRLREVDLTPRLARIGLPTLLTCGRFDEATPATVEDFRRLIPGARIKVFESASHNHHLEQAQGYLAAVREFLL